MKKCTALPNPPGRTAQVIDLSDARRRRTRRPMHALVDIINVIREAQLGRLDEGVAVAMVGELWYEANDLLPRPEPGWFLRAFGMETPA